jgi:hypothetical protein
MAGSYTISRSTHASERGIGRERQKKHGNARNPST